MGDALESLFQSTLPAWGETQRVAYQLRLRLISIHSPRMGRDFQQRLDAGQHFNPLSPHGERHRRRGDPEGRETISIHSPRMGRDGMPAEIWPGPWNFNPLSPHGERPSPTGEARRTANFNPLSPHGERHRPFRRPTCRLYFNPLSPHGERPFPSG